MGCLFLLPRSATSLYVYWVISPQRKRMIETHFKTNWSALPKILRIYDVSCIDFNGHNANRYTEITIHDAANHWFIHDMSDNCNYCADFGTKTMDNRYFTLMRSNTVKTPPANVQSAKAGIPMSTEIHQTILSEPEWMQRFTGYSLQTQIMNRLILD